MRIDRLRVCALWALALTVCAAGAARASLTLTSGLGTTHVGNLVTNGSFEIGAPPNGAANNFYWATGTANLPFLVPPGWNSSGAAANAGRWGNDAPGPPYRLKSSDVLPDGRAGIFFGNGTGFVTQPPTMNPINGSITFPNPPVFTSTTGAPAIIGQSVPTNLLPQPAYRMSFWVSGEENSTNQGNTGLSIMGFRITNVLPGDPIQYLTVPNGIFLGQSHLYEYAFTPLNPLLPVNIAFMTWGHMDLSPFPGGTPFGTEAVIDDVIINAAVPEPATIGLVAVGGALIALRRRARIAALACAIATIGTISLSSTARASLTLTTGLGTTHTGNLVTNGSFENGAPADGISNWTYWATGSTQGPVVVPPGWTSSGAPQTYAFWGNDGSPNYHTNFSAILPDGRIGVYFGNGAPVLVNQPPTFNANATVSFPSTPSFTNNFTNNVPAILQQTVPTNTNVAPVYKLSFWVSGEDAGGFSAPFGGPGIFGLRVTNTLAGDPIQWLAVPESVTGTYGSSHLFEYLFTPLNPLNPVTLEFTNWGHFDLSAYGGTNFTTELVLDDVIVNTVVPEPASIASVPALVLLASCARVGRGRNRSSS